MLCQDIAVAKENIIRITEYKNFFLRDSITLYFKHDDAELEALIKNFCKTMTQDILPKKQRRSYLC